MANVGAECFWHGLEQGNHMRDLLVACRLFHILVEETHLGRSDGAVMAE